MNLIDLDDSSGSKITLPDPEEVFGEVDTLRKEIQKQIELRKEKEK